MTRIVAISDIQSPYEDSRAVAAVWDFIGRTQPDMVVSVGDEVDFPQVSRWTRGMEGEYRGDLQAHVTHAVGLLQGLRDVYGGPIHITRSNHVDRPLTYVRKYAPGLMGLKALTIPSLLELDRLGIEYHVKPFQLAPGWLLMHGDEGSLSRVPGSTAMGLARKTGMSVICGHTHRLGLQHDTTGYGAKLTRVLYGLEAGNLMDPKRVSYLKLGGASANWHQGFAILDVDGRRVTPVPVPIRNGRFSVNGVNYGG